MNVLNERWFVSRYTATKVLAGDDFTNELVGNFENPEVAARVVADHNERCTRERFTRVSFLGCGNRY